MNESDFIIYPYDEAREMTAEYFANMRLPLEYPRKGYGKYDKSHLKNLKFGYLGEFAFLEYVSKYFPKEFIYQINIGKQDDGYDFLIKNKKIDVKTYGTKEVELSEIMNLNLLIDKRQQTKADTYVQAFILKDKRICLTGYHVGLPTLTADWAPVPAWYCPVSGLKRLYQGENI